VGVNFYSNIYRIGTEKRPDVADSRNHIPGPGNYTVKERMGEGPKIALSPRYEEKKEKMFVPGPGAYEPNSKSVQGKSAATGLGIGVRGFINGKAAANVPGPGSYTPPQKSVEGPKFGFGKSERADIKKHFVPGPGNYSINPSFANVPTYERSKMKQRLS
jgi:hypothetical protein